MPPTSLFFFPIPKSDALKREEQHQGRDSRSAVNVICIDRDQRLLSRNHLSPSWIFAMLMRQESGRGSLLAGGQRSGGSVGLPCEAPLNWPRFGGYSILLSKGHRNRRGLRRLRHNSLKPFILICFSKASPDGEIGRRSGLKIRREQSRGGSSPPPGTIIINKLSITVTWPAPVLVGAWWETESHPSDRPPHFAIAGSCVSTYPW